MEKVNASRGYNAAVSTKKTVSSSAAPKFVPAVRIIFVALAAIIAVYTLTFANSEPQRVIAFRSALPVMCAVTCVLFAAAALWLIIIRVKKTDVAGYCFTPAMACGITGAAFAVCLVNYIDKYVSYIPGLSAKIIFAVIIIAALYLIRHVFSGSFFAFGVYTALSAMLCLFASGTIGTAALIFAAVMIVFALAAVVFVFLSGTPHFNSLDRIAFSCVSGVLVVFAGLSFAFSGVIIFALYALLAVFLVFTIINTIKMI